jgi:hypothetical protein
VIHRAEPVIGSAEGDEIHGYAGRQRSNGLATGDVQTAPLRPTDLAQSDDDGANSAERGKHCGQRGDPVGDGRCHRTATLRNFIGWDKAELGNTKSAERSRLEYAGPPVRISRRAPAAL